MIVGFRGVTWESVTSGRLLESEFGRVLAAKLLLILLMLVLTVVHDVVLGPASGRALADPSPAAARTRATLRRRTSRLARLNVVIAVLVVACAVALVRGLPW